MMDVAQSTTTGTSSYARKIKSGDEKQKTLRVLREFGTILILREHTLKRFF